MEKLWHYVEHQGPDGKKEIVYETRENLLMVGNGGTLVLLTPGKKTKEECIADNEILEAPCVCCGNPVVTHFVEPVRTRLKKGNICFSCDLWSDRAAKIDDPNRVVVNGCMYTIGADTVGPGFGGSEFKIKRFGSEEIISTRNLWHGGPIPAIFKDRIKDNAEFIRPEPVKLEI